MQILHLDTSILGDASASRVLSAAIVETLQQETPAVQVIHRDLTVEAIPHLDGAIAAGFRPIGVTPTDAAVLAEHARSEALVGEFLASDVIVIGAPMYNFSVASQLKAWIDRIAQPGRTFRYTETGPVGLAAGKTVIIASTRGGMHSAGPTVGMDFQEAYLKAFFGFIGITNVQFVRAERLTKGADVRGQVLEAALATIPGVVSQAVAN